MAPGSDVGPVCHHDHRGQRQHPYVGHAEAANAAVITCTTRHPGACSSTALRIERLLRGPPPSQRLERDRADHQPRPSRSAPSLACCRATRRHLRLCQALTFEERRIRLTSSDVATYPSSHQGSCAIMIASYSESFWMPSQLLASLTRPAVGWRARSLSWRGGPHSSSCSQGHPSCAFFSLRSL